VARVLVTEKIAQSGLDELAAAGHEVDVQEGSAPRSWWPPSRAAALIIRSATQVTAEVLEAATDLIVVGRAGIGLDNVDVDAATERGVMVVNAPQSNILSAAEQTMALLLAQAATSPGPRRPRGRALGALEVGGVELHGKTSASSAWAGSARSSPSGPSPSA